ncbi:MAG TPA: hypothetical protein VF981_07620 [Gemmatimonadaceae bacterium]
MAYQPNGDPQIPGSTIRVTPEEEPVIPAVLYAFAPLHKRAFGIAVGTAGALFMAFLTIGGLVLPRGPEFPLRLIEQYFTGYSVSWPGVVVGAAWGFVVAFVGGWFAAFCRNLALAISAFAIKTRAEYEATREFLDHI